MRICKPWNAVLTSLWTLWQRGQGRPRGRNETRPAGNRHGAAATRADPTQPSTVANELRSELDALLNAWFPRSIDPIDGGFLCDFDYRWRPSGPQHKMLEFQARQTLAAARGARSGMRAEMLRDAALHGFRHLRDTQWDHRLGGWYRMLDRAGNPLESATKHGHGASYAISACVACYELTGRPECLELAKSAFGWLEKHAHDAVNGGYFVFYQQDGTPILSPDQAPSGTLRDAMGTPVGFKDANTTSDLLKGFSDLYRVWPDALLRHRAEELLGIVRDRLVVAPGVMHMYTHPDWTPVPDFVRYGQVIRSANLLLSASEVLFGTVDSRTKQVAQSMIDAMLCIARDPELGGFLYAGSSFGPIHLEGRPLSVASKAWWPQADGIRALLWFARLFPEREAEYRHHFTQLWEYIRRHLIDSRHGGWFSSGLDTDPGARTKPKAHAWKDCSHETEALVEGLLLLEAS